MGPLLFLSSSPDWGLDQRWLSGQIWADSCAMLTEMALRAQAMLRGPRHSLVTLRSWLVAPKSLRGAVICSWPQASPRVLLLDAGAPDTTPGQGQLVQLHLLCPRQGTYLGPLEPKAQSLAGPQGGPGRSRVQVPLHGTTLCSALTF